MSWFKIIAGFIKDIERSDLIVTRYLSEIDEVLVSTLDSCPFAISAFMVLRMCGAVVVHPPNLFDLTMYGLIFDFNCDDLNQRLTLQSFIHHSAHIGAEHLMFDFLSNPQRSQHHVVDNKMHNSITERCFSYIINRSLAHFPGIHHWASKSKHRPWLWKWQRPKGAITSTLLEFRHKDYIGFDKKLEPFWALVLALKYLPYLLNKATRSEELIALTEMWPYRYPLLVSLFPHDTKKAGKAVKHYLTRVDGKEQCENEVVVGPPLLCIV